MIDEKYIELMHKEIDGIIEPHEMDQLEKYMSDNDEGRHYYEDLMQTANLLKDFPSVSPPKGLKKQIMESLDWSRYQRKTKRPDLFSILSNWFFQPQYKLAYAFATGLIVGVFLYAFFFSTFNMQEPLDNTDLYGMIGQHSNIEINDLQDIPIDLDEINGHVHLRQFKEFIVFDVNLKSSSPFDLSLQYESQNYRFRGFQRDDNSNVFLKEDSDIIEISTSENAKYLVFFNMLNKKSTPIDLKILSAGRILTHQSIYINTF